MKASEKRRALYDAVSGIDPKLVQAATAPKPVKVVRTVWKVAAAAAMVAILIGVVAGLPFGLMDDEEYVTAPGTLSIRAYALDENEISEVNSTVLKEGVELPWEYVWGPGINIVRGLPIKLDFPTEGYGDAKITLEVSTTGGSFFGKPVRYQDPITKEYHTSDYPYLGNNFTTGNNYTIYWNIFSKTVDPLTGKEVYDYDAPRKSYVDIVIFADDIIVGYAVVEIYELLPEGESNYIDGVHRGYLSRVVEIVSFPKVDGEFQPVSRRYVEKKFNELHQAN